jgi:hypothetical protein
MPVDRAARDRLAAVLAQYMRGEADNFALDEAAAGVKTDDEAVLRLGRELWFAYDDLKRHSVSADRRLWEALRRTIAFLRSDIPLPSEKPTRRRWLHPGQLWGVAAFGSIVVAAAGAWNGPDLCWFLPGIAVGVPFTVRSMWRSSEDDSPTDSCYPFASETDWRAHEHLVLAERLPPFDPAVHDRPVRDSVVSFIMLLPFALFLAPLAALFSLLPRKEAVGPGPTA